MTRPEGDLEPVRRMPYNGHLQEASEVVSLVNQAGGKAFLVGGCVRDLLMYKAPKDVDIEVYGLQPDHLESTLAQLGKVDKVGKSFGVLKLRYKGQEFDVSIPRREQKTGKGYKGFIASPDPTMTLADAGRRRDFTINAIAMDPLTGHIYDPHNGVADLDAKLLRAVDERAFSEDPLRILRGAQFAARHLLTVHEETLALMRAATHELKDLPKERVHVEWKKLLTKGVEPSRGVNVLIKTGALEALHPELHALGSYHLQDALHYLDLLVKREKGLTPVSREAVQIAMLLRHLGNAETVRRVAIDQLGAVKEVAAKVVALVQEADTVTRSEWLTGKPLGEGDIRRLAGRLRPATVEELALVVMSLDSVHEWLVDFAQRHDVHNGPTKPLLTGKHLSEMGVVQGPRVGALIKQVLELQLDGRVRTVDEAKEAARQALAGE
jgi:tRNA nucleotidyltransferase (CCA-adding enzyme)